MTDGSATKTWEVLVVDKFHEMDPDEPKTLVCGFLNWEDARDYARAITWSSVRECCGGATDTQPALLTWQMFGETAFILGEPHYSGSDEIRYFLANEPTKEQVDWTGIARRAAVTYRSRKDQQ
jgi:hypothetical protein